MQKPPDADHQVDLELRLLGIECVWQVDLDDGRTDLQGTHLGASQESDKIEDQLGVGELELQVPQTALLGMSTPGTRRQQ